MLLRLISTTDDSTVKTLAEIEQYHPTESFRGLTRD